MDTIWAIAFVLALPAILMASLLFPFYWIRLYRTLRSTGSWFLRSEDRSRLVRAYARAVAAAYALSAGTLFFPGAFPRIHALWESGWVLAVVALPLIVDLAVAAALPMDRALDEWKAGRPRKAA